MTSLNRGRIKTGIWHVQDATELKVENTQEYQDTLYDLKTGIDEGFQASRLLLSQYHYNLLGLWRSEGEEAPFWMSNTLSEWTEDNFKAFLKQILKWSADHQQDDLKTVRQRVQILLLRDQSFGQNQAMKKIQEQLKSDESSVVDNQASVKQLVSEIPTNELQVSDDNFEKKQGLKRLQMISRSSMLHARQLANQRVTRSRIIKVNTQQEARRVTDLFKKQSDDQKANDKPKQTKKDDLER